MLYLLGAVHNLVIVINIQKSCDKLLVCIFLHIEAKVRNIKKIKCYYDIVALLLHSLFVEDSCKIDLLDDCIVDPVIIVDLHGIIFNM